MLASTYENDVALIHELWHEYASALIAGDMERWISLWIRRGIELSAAGQLLSGTEQIRAASQPVVDLFDIVRAGVSVGPGIGVDLTATEYLNVTLMTKASVGVGYETLRHLPIEAASYAMIGVGPVKAAADPGLAWPRSPGDIRIELHLLLAGAHVAIEPFEIFDFVVGFIGIDPMEDSF